MKFRKVTLSLAAVAVASVAFAHHLPVGLSSVFGSEVLSKIVFLADGPSLGVPPYVVGTDEDATVLTEGASFAVSDGNGGSETVTFAASQFADIGAAESHEIVDALNAQLTLASALIENSSIVLVGKTGGADSQLVLTDGAGGPLGALGLLPGVISGTDDIELSLSIPADHEDVGPGDSHDGEGLAHHPYLLVGSTTAGVTHVAGFQVPLAIDATTEMLLRATSLGLLPGFQGELDASEDALAVFKTALLGKLYPAGLPDSLYFSFVVFNEHLDGIEYVSNRFEVQIQK